MNHMNFIFLNLLMFSPIYALFNLLQQAYATFIIEEILERKLVTSQWEFCKTVILGYEGNKYSEAEGIWYWWKCGGWNF